MSNDPKDPLINIQKITCLNALKRVNEMLSKHVDGTADTSLDNDLDNLVSELKATRDQMNWTNEVARLNAIRFDLHGLIPRGRS